jgi:hypothetical protein
MARRTHRQMLLDTLMQSKEARMNNNTLRDTLGWDATRYQSVRDKLILEGLIYIARGGPGGTVSLTAAPEDNKPAPVKLFVSYSHKDVAIKNEFLKHLSTLKRLGKIHDWHDQDIEAGGKLHETIEQNLQSADIVVFLISVDFINSDYCYVKELGMVLEKAAKQEVAIIPVIVRDCMWKETVFGGYKALPPDGKPMTSWATPDEALTAVAEGIAKRLSKS